MNGEQGARLESTMRENETVLVRWLTNRLGDPDAANDVAQSAFLRVWKFAGGAVVTNPRALLFKTAGNLATNELRRRSAVAKRQAPSSRDDTEAAIDRVATSDPTPEKQTSVKQELERTLKAIEALPEPARTAFKLNRFEGLSYREIAKRLGVSESSVEKYMIKALKALRQQLRENGER